MMQYNPYKKRTQDPNTNLGSAQPRVRMPGPNTPGALNEQENRNTAQVKPTFETGGPKLVDRNVGGRALLKPRFTPSDVGTPDVESAVANLNFDGMKQNTGLSNGYGYKPKTYAPKINYSSPKTGMVSAPAGTLGTTDMGDGTLPLSALPSGGKKEWKPINVTIDDYKKAFGVEDPLTPKQIEQKYIDAYVQNAGKRAAQSSASARASTPSYYTYGQKEPSVYDKSYDESLAKFDEKYGGDFLGYDTSGLSQYDKDIYDEYKKQLEALGDSRDQYKYQEDELERERYQQLQQAFINKVMAEKYLPTQLKAAGLGGLGVSQTTLAQMQNDYRNNLNDISSNISAETRELARSFLDSIRDMKSKGRDTISDLEQTREESKKAEALEQYDKILNNSKNASVVQDYIDKNRKYLSENQIENLNYIKNYLSQAKKGEGYIKDPQTGQSYTLQEKLDPSANEIRKNDSFTEAVKALGYSGPYDEKIPNGTTVTIERENDGSWVNSGFMSVVRNTNKYLAPWTRLLDNARRKTLTYFDGNWYVSA